MVAAGVRSGDGGDEVRRFPYRIDWATCTLIFHGGRKERIDQLRPKVGPDLYAGVEMAVMGDEVYDALGWLAMRGFFTKHATSGEELGEDTVRDKLLEHDEAVSFELVAPRFAVIGQPPKEELEGFEGFSMIHGRDFRFVWGVGRDEGSARASAAEQMDTAGEFPQLETEVVPINKLQAIRIALGLCEWPQLEMHDMAGYQESPF